MQGPICAKRGSAQSEHALDDAHRDAVDRASQDRVVAAAGPRYSTVRQT